MARGEPCETPGASHTHLSPGLTLLPHSQQQFQPGRCLQNRCITKATWTAGRNRPRGPQPCVKQWFPAAPPKESTLPSSILAPDLHRQSQKLTPSFRTRGLKAVTAQLYGHFSLSLLSG